MSFCVQLGFAADQTAEEVVDRPTTTSGRIVEVTLYRDSATVTREIEVSMEPGNSQVVVDQLPDQLIVESVFAEGNETVAVRAVRVITEPVTESTSKEVRELEAKIQELLNEKKAMEIRLEAITSNATALDEMVAFTSEKSREDLNGGVLKSETITVLFEFSAIKRMELHELAFSTNLQMQELDR